MSSSFYVGQREFFPGVGRIPFEGRDSDNPLAYKVYDADKQIGGRSMAEHLRFAVCYWHTFCNSGQDPFGPGTRRFPWDSGEPLAAAEPRKVRRRMPGFRGAWGVAMYCGVSA